MVSSSHPGGLAPQVSNSTLPQRPPNAVGQFLRMLSINDAPWMDQGAQAHITPRQAKRLSKSMQCVVTSHMCGDFMGPCLHTSLEAREDTTSAVSKDGGITMMEALNFAKLDYVSLGNHEHLDGNAGMLPLVVPPTKGKLLNTNGKDEQLKSLPEYDVDVGGKKVLIVGLCIADPSIYAANSCPAPWQDGEHLSPQGHPTVLHARLKDASRKGHYIDLVVPMTHQLIEDDRLLAAPWLSDLSSSTRGEEQFEMHETMSGKAPVILGGHEHTVFEEEPDTGGGGLELDLCQWQSTP
eukprot:Skav234840  [mRNA]  locus=scaffold1428:228913:238504:- [translate_table: standard]